MLSAILEPDRRVHYCSHSQPYHRRLKTGRSSKLILNPILKGETVNGPMLRVKRERFEKQMDVLENERLTGDGWVANFCSAYKIKEFRRHGEAGSVDLAGVATECIRVQKKFANVAPCD